MSIPKRLRYEILQRDNYTCRYCGRSSPEVALTVDHVTPVVLGGTDEPSNLVAACVDCNAGKASTSPDQALIEDVEQDSFRWSRAMQQAAELQHAREAEFRHIWHWFDDEWRKWHYGPSQRELPRPVSWRETVKHWVAASSTTEDLAYALDVAMRSKADPENTWRYFCGVMWRTITERQEIAKALLAQEEVGDGSH